MTYEQQPGPYSTQRKHHGLEGSPTIKAVKGRLSSYNICVFTIDDRTGKRWAQLKHTLAGWEGELGLIKSLANEARERASEWLKIFKATPSNSCLVVERRLAYRAAQNESRERDYEYEHCFNAIKGAKELLRKVGKFIV